MSFQKLNKTSSKETIFRQVEYILCSEHSYKKLKDSLEIRVKPAALRVYVENQVLLEPILPYYASKCKQTQKQGIRSGY